VSKHSAELHWSRNGQPFLDGRYSRCHEVRFAASIRVVGSASAHVVPIEYCEPNALDPEAAFVASLSGCHMLWFLSIAQSAGFRVDDYHDRAEGTLGKTGDGTLAMTQVMLKPHVCFDALHAPDAATYRDLHERAHAECFIARSVRCTLGIEPTFSLNNGA
jgi:organic hydroperoxide reductase OsmC/OhrA